MTFSSKSLGECCEIKDIFSCCLLIVYVDRNVCWQTYALYVSLKVSLRFSCYCLESSKERLLSEVLSFQKAAVYIGSRIGTYLQNEKLWVYKKEHHIVHNMLAWFDWSTYGVNSNFFLLDELRFLVGVSISKSPN